MTVAHSTYMEQTLHYFTRDHTGLPSGPVGGPAAWLGADLAATPEQWSIDLTDDQVDAIDRGVGHALSLGRPLESLTAADFPLGDVDDSIDRWRAEITDGRGFVLLHGAPVEEWGVERSEAAFWGLGLHLGTPGFQNHDGQLLGHVTDVGGADEGTRSYKTNRNIRYHCDAADIVGLMCLATASSGGLSRLASSVTVFDILLSEQPDLAARLFEPFELDTRSDDTSIRHVPVEPCRFDGTRLRTFFHADYFGSADRHDDVTLSDLDRATLAAYEEIAERPEVRLDMELAVGDIQLVSNHTVVHARTAYDDLPSGTRRHLLRLWVSVAR